MAVCLKCKGTDFLFLEDRYFVCESCGHQNSENAIDHAEVDMDKDGKNRFGATNSASMIDRQGNLLLDVSMPFEPPSRLSVGSVTLNDAARKQSKRMRVNRLVEDVLTRLVDPLNVDHAMDVVQRIRRTCHGMLSHILQTDDEDITDDDFAEDSDHVKNRGMRKRAIFVHLTTRVILHFIPDYDDKKYRSDVMLPYFGSRVGRDSKKCTKFIYKYGVPVLKRIFPDFDRMFEDDFLVHQQCKVRRMFRCLYEQGRYAPLFQKDDFYLLFECAGAILFHPGVVAQLQSWKLWTRVGTILCLMNLTEPKEFVRFLETIDDEPVKEITILNHMTEPLGVNILENVMRVTPEWKELFTGFRTARAFCL